MPVARRRSKADLLSLIDSLQKTPQDKVRLFAEAGIIIPIVAFTGPPASAALISAMTSVFGMSVSSHLFGWFVALGWAAAPVSLIVACAAFCGWCGYIALRLVRGGAMAEGRKQELLLRYREMLQEILNKEASAAITDQDRNSFILSLRELVDTNTLPISSAFRLIEQVELGHIALSHAVQMIQACLRNDRPARPPH